ncbi:hypothetical protein DSCA_18650 [Desulfosarcina alkanivorans]|uniref:DUF1156 domain-containing protein n=1 Tax=Desulfosarcina alkanivorans TaxID=571177 RepID=A0A5K7YHQ1_9BACT|nr:DUF1156 domain-containing protein [Desulfosarcina alkanivorans]BBO67935.1 hypothetical protein DSCA_18650 [Desulfosarcina alkanivorans]
MNYQNPKQLDISGNVIEPTSPAAKKNGRKSKADKLSSLLPAKLGKAVRLPVPDFSNPDRTPTCLEADFPIAQINALSNLEGNAGKPIYQMSKWWARRRSSVFRSMLIAAAVEAPEDPNEAAKLVWDHYYCNHQKAGSFKQLKVLDCFMGGGTTLVEGSRLGMQMTGVDLNPVAWFVVKNELACSDPEQVKALFEEIERQVKPQIQPFYTTTCPRGHQGRWIDVESGETVNLDPIELAPGQRSRYRWEGPEVIYTFWAKHGPCQAKGCGHRTPIFRTPVIAEKKLSTGYAELTCPGCGTIFHAELGETRMAPGAERVVVDGDVPFTELTQDFARLLNEYDKGNANDTWERALALKATVLQEPGLHCPQCGTFAGKRLADVIEHHSRPSLRATQRKKKDFSLKKKPVQMYLLIHPDWMKGASGFSGEEELGGWAGAPAEATVDWFEKRLKHLRMIELRGKSLPDAVTLADGTTIETGQGTVPQRSTFQCANCGRIADIATSEREAKHNAPIAPYTLQCHCPKCAAEGYTYGGRYFKAPGKDDLWRLSESEKEWSNRAEVDLSEYWPRSVLPYAWETHVQKGNLTTRGYTHWWKMFNPRQLLVHANLLKAITEAREASWPLDVREQVLGAFQQYLRNQNMFCFWDTGYDKLVPMMSNPNYHPKNLAVENCVFNSLGRGNWQSNTANAVGGVEWAKTPWECLLLPGTEKAKSQRLELGDPIIPGNEPYCGSSTDLSMLGNEQFDLVITDPPFGNNLYYADLADFFYVWLRIPLRKWYAGLPEVAYFDPEFTPKALQAIDDPAQHPDDREDYEKETFIESKYLDRIQELTGDDALTEKDPNPLYRQQPSSDFYSQTLSACWAEAGHRLKDGGIMAFTFHHNEDQAWIDVLRALFDAGYVLVSTYPVRSDETKGDAANAAFGSKKIEYDIIHVCRKRLTAPEPVSWARMRRWVKDETVRLKELLEHTHGTTLPESDLRVILRGKSLEFYSRHYGQVFTGDGQVLEVRDALLGINQLLDDMLEDTTQTGGLRPPDSAEPASRLYLRLFKNRTEMERDELHKTLRGTGIAQGDLEAKGWIRVVGRAVHVVPIHERFAFFTERGRNRKVIKTDLDQAHFLIGTAYPNSGLRIDVELNNPNFRIKKSVDEILKWFAEVDPNPANRMAARTAAQLVEHWRNRKDRSDKPTQLSLFEMLDME